MFEVIKGHIESVNAVDITPDGKFIVSTSSDMTLSPMEYYLSTDESKQVENETFTKDVSLTQGKPKQQRETAGLFQDYLALELADSRTLEECCKFLIKYPDSRFRQAVIGRMKWLQTEENGSHEKYRLFLKNNPKSIYAAKARLRLKQLAIMESWNKFKE